MRNRDIERAWAYHEATKLSYINLRNKPPLYKRYTRLRVIPLPTDFCHPEVETLGMVVAGAEKASPSVDLATLAELLFFSAGLVKSRTVPTVGQVQYRAAASAGALYPVEVYVVCTDIPGLEAGVYHFSPEDFALSQLRTGDYRAELCGAAGGEGSVSYSPVTLVFTGIFWRSAWKYRVRSYRYCFWDTGTMVANLLAVADAEALTTQVIAGFVDDRVNRLLGVQGKQEAALSLVTVGAGAVPGPLPAPLDTSPLSGEALGAHGDEAEYPEICLMHRASSLVTEEEVVAWRGALMAHHPHRGEGPSTSLAPPGDAVLPSGRLGDVILGRVSTRRFDPEPISLPQFRDILGRSTRGFHADFLGRGGPSLIGIYTIVNAINGVPSGSYHFSPNQQVLELLKEGDFREEAGHLCFEQALGADASVVMYLMSDLERVLGRYGNRGYRAAQLEAGILGGKLYLCAQSLGLGASGLTFYDDDIADFFSPHGSGMSAMFVIALGVTAQKNRVRPYRSRVGAVLDALARGATDARS